MSNSKRNDRAAAEIDQLPVTTSSNGGNPRTNEDFPYDVHKSLENFWQHQEDKIEKMAAAEFRENKISQELPLARIKKIMKLDEDVKSQMISAEAPVLFAKACEMFIEELTLRAWIHTEDNKRKTLQKNDIAMAISKHDQFDFLIDIVPREEIMKSAGGGSAHSPNTSKRTSSSPAVAHVESHLPMFVQVAAPSASAIVTQPTMQAVQFANGQIVQAQALGSQTLQLVQGANGELQLVSLGGASQTQPPVLHAASTVQQLHQQQLDQQDASTGQSSSAPFAQAFQQIVAPDGTVHHLPIQLSPAQMNYLKQHLNTASGGQQIQIVQGSNASTSGTVSVSSRGQLQQQTAFFVPTSAPIGQTQQQGGIQLQILSSDHQIGAEETTS